MSVPLQALTLVLALLVVIWTIAARRRFLFRLGVRNLARRKVNTVIVVCGLMIGTAIISGSLIVGDTLENLFTKNVYDSFDQTDETIFTYTPNRTLAFFDRSVCHDLEALAASDPALSGLVEDMSPEISLRVSAFCPRTRLSEPGINLIGFNYNESKTFGGFYPTTGGTMTGEDLRPGEVLVNELVAEELDVRKGDRIVIYYGINGSATFVVREVVEFRGRAAYGMFMGRGALNVLMRLDHLQEILGVGDRINLIKVSNWGDSREGVRYSDAVVDGLAPHLRRLPMPLLISKDKQESLDLALRSSEMLQQLFLVLGSFSIIAGVLLVVNIFVMLAEERKPEMGICRAIGLRLAGLCPGRLAIRSQSHRRH